MPYTEPLRLAVAEAPFGVVVCECSAEHRLHQSCGRRDVRRVRRGLLGSPIDHIRPGRRSSNRGARPESRSVGRPGPPLPLLSWAQEGWHVVPRGNRRIGGRPERAGRWCSVPIVDVSSSHELEKVLGDHQAFDRAIADVATGFIATEGGSLDDRIAGGQRRVAEVLGVDRSSLSAAGWRRLRVYAHLEAGRGLAGAAAPAVPPASQCFPWVLEQVTQRPGGVVHEARPAPVLDRSGELPPARTQGRGSRSRSW